MKFFIDTAEVDEVAKLAEAGLVDGVTTNPSLVAKAGRDFATVIAEMCRLTSGPVSAEVAATERDAMLREADALRRIADNVCIKLPLTPDGLAAARRLSAEGTMTNLTLCFSAAQALLAAKAGATFVSPFVGRLDDIGHDGMELIADMVTIFGNYPVLETQVLVASVRHPGHLLDAARLGADVATVPPKVVWQLFHHPLTDKGLATFLADWQASGQRIPETPA
ncbi:fructose-6-phosphate aldolase [Roseospirillum parvum]|uniref:Probable transaldolase n=1 Tax=Roseospirillum parvum TaxID=83401 RepID=A0A1G7V4B9_9PROT|nr:fructose-6-phosphate aldolase [Roseospirillum parvum]SDG54606.1 transaldolase [Roseospirillum parvum]